MELLHHHMSSLSQLSAVAVSVAVVVSSDSVLYCHDYFGYLDSPLSLLTIIATATAIAIAIAAVVGSGLPKQWAC